MEWLLRAPQEMGASSKISIVLLNTVLPLAVPASAVAGAPTPDADAQWQNFSQVMNQSPENAWRYLSNMGPEAFRSKLLFLDNA